MQRVLLATITIFFVSTGMAFATDNAAGGAGSYKPYTCELNDDGVETCYCAGKYDCRYMAESGVCDVPFPQGGPDASSNDTSCNSDFGGVGEHVCECSAELSGPKASRRPDRFDISDGTSNTITLGERDSSSSKEVVSARRGNAPDDTVVPSRGTVAPTPPGVPTPYPNIGTAADQKPKNKKRTSLQGIPRACLQKGRSLTKKGTGKGPSGVSLLNIGRTSLTLCWADTTTWEYGVSVERGTPSKVKGRTNYNWKQVFKVEERVEDRTKGTGRRGDVDDTLRPNTKYCYRLRAYRGNRVSDYSAPICAKTLR